MTDTVEQTLPADISGWTVRALVPTDGGFDVYPGTGTATGTFSIPGVPIGVTYYLNVESFFIVTSASSVDLGEVRLGRPDTVPAAVDPSNLVLNVTGLQAWQQFDELQAVSSNAGVVRFNTTSGAANAPAIGATALAGTTVNWVGDPLVQGGTGGDRLTVAQLSQTTSAGGVEHSRLAAFYQAPVFEQVDGVGSTLTGAFSGVVLDQAVTLDWRRSQFASLLSDMHPRGTGYFEQLAVSVLPRGGDYGVYDPAPDLLYIKALPSSDDLATDALSFGNPYPSSWDQLGQVASYATVSYTVGTATAGTLYGVLAVEDELAAFGSSPIRPKVGPVQGLAVNGIAATTDLTGVTQTPTLSWSAPGVGAADYYNVNVYRLADVGGKTSFRRDATFMTSDTSVRIPPGILDALGTYVFAVAAQFEPAHSVDTAPWRWHVPRGVAEAFTEKVQP